MLAVGHFSEWTPRLMQDLTGLPRAAACQLLMDLAAEGHLEGAFQRYRPAPSPGLRQLLGIPDGPRPFDALKAAASWLTARGWPMQSLDVYRGLIKATSTPGRPGVHACANIRQWFPKHIWPGLLPHIYRGKPNVAGWQLLLSEAWSNLEGGSSVVVEAAVTHDTLVKWFRYADYGNVLIPYFRKFLSLDVPADIVLYRGGQGAQKNCQRASAGQPIAPLAASYASTEVQGRRPNDPSTDGQQRRIDAAAYWHNGSDHRSVGRSGASRSRHHRCCRDCRA